MRVLPWAPDTLLMWRLDPTPHAATWDSGIGAQLGGGRWNPRGMAVVYCSVDPSTAILEVAVHKTFNTFDRLSHTLTCAELLVPDELHIVTHADVPNTGWLRPGTPSRAQQQFGQDLLTHHLFVAIPSAVSEKSWNILFNPALAVGKYRLLE